MHGVSQTLTEPAKRAITRAGVYNFLATIFHDPVQGTRILGSVETLQAMFKVWTENLPDYELGPCLTKLEEALNESAPSQLTGNGQSGYQERFQSISATGLPPYETEYCSPHVFEKSQQLADIAGFYRAFGYSSENRERPDHVGAELEFLRILCLMEAYAETQGWNERFDITIDAQRKFLSDHLGRWIDYFCEQLAENSSSSSFHALAELTREFIDKEILFLKAAPVFVTRRTPPSKETPDSSSCGDSG